RCRGRGRRGPPVAARFFRFRCRAPAPGHQRRARLGRRPPRQRGRARTFPLTTRRSAMRRVRKSNHPHRAPLDRTAEHATDTCHYPAGRQASRAGSASVTCEVIAALRPAGYLRDMTTMTSHARPQRPVGELLREWRERRRLSQLDLSIQADISTRHLSFVETGRSRPTPAMIIRLTEQLDVPLRERNTLLLAAGYAPAYPQHRLDEPELSSVGAALRRVLAGHQPYPAVVVDRWWEMLDSNTGISLLVGGCAPRRLRTPRARAPPPP